MISKNMLLFYYNYCKSYVSIIRSLFFSYGVLQIRLYIDYLTI